MDFFYPKRYAGFLLCMALSGSVNVFAQQKNEVTVRVSYDSSAIAELFNTIPVGFTFISPVGTSASTRGWLRGTIRWSSLHITTPQGTLKNGQLTFDRRKVWENGHRVTFYIKKGDASFTCDLPLPHVENIRFNLYTDSLKRDNPFYLNVEGRFTSGRVYPLDTNMVAFRESGGGALRGNVVLVKKSDTGIHRVRVSAWLLADPQIRDSISIPVKIIPDPATLPTEQQLLKDWKEKK